jgi:hypothetical protein
MRRPTWALVSGHWSAGQAARVEVAQERDIRKRDEEDIAGDVVHLLVQETDLTAIPDAPPAATPLAADPPKAPPGWYEGREGLRWWTGAEWDAPG